MHTEIARERGKAPHLAHTEMGTAEARSRIRSAHDDDDSTFRCELGRSSDDELSRLARKARRIQQLCIATRSPAPRTCGRISAQIPVVAGKLNVEAPRPNWRMSE